MTRAALVNRPLLGEHAADEFCADQPKPCTSTLREVLPPPPAGAGA